MNLLRYIIIHSLKESITSSDGATTRFVKESSWGCGSGTKDDNDILSDIIASELRKPENQAISNHVHILI